jgi:peptide deformylase
VSEVVGPRGDVGAGPGAGLSLRLHPDPILRAGCAPVAGDVSALARAMLGAMYAAPGRGLAAPQVGLALRLFVMDAGWKEGRPDPRVYVNPEVIWASDETDIAREACLSIPGVSRPVRRPSACTLAHDGPGGRAVARLEGFAARCAQHEMDHLDGRLILDHPEARA